jgi:thiamine biosynthesis lipoprotein
MGQIPFPQGFCFRATATSFHRRTERLMGSRFGLEIECAGADRAQTLLDEAVAEIRRIEALLTEFSETSVTAALVRAAGREPVAVPGEVYELLFRCGALSRLTQGAFDITVGPLKRLYDFKNAPGSMPGAAELREALQKTGHEKVRLLPGRRVLLEKPGMRIGFGAVGKGYAADRAAQLLQAHGVRSGSVNASGDLRLWGPAVRRVGIADPAAPGRCLYYIGIQNGAVATSGDYEQHFYHAGRRYSHNIDPRTGRPLSGLASVTVVAPGAELADALATAVYAMGTDAGLHLVDQLDGVHALIIDEAGRTFHSSGLQMQPADA